MAWRMTEWLGWRCLWTGVLTSRMSIRWGKLAREFSLKIASVCCGGAEERMRKRGLDLERKEEPAEVEGKGRTGLQMDGRGGDLTLRKVWDGAKGKGSTL